MKTPEQSQRENAVNLFANETLILRASQRTPEQSSATVARGKHQRLAVFVFLMSLGAIAALVYLLRAVPADVLRQEFESLGIVSCALASVGIFLRHVTRALAQD